MFLLLSMQLVVSLWFLPFQIDFEELCEVPPILLRVVLLSQFLLLMLLLLLLVVVAWPQILENWQQFLSCKHTLFPIWKIISLPESLLTVSKTV